MVVLCSSKCSGCNERGIALIHQELNLASNLDLAANIFLGREPNKNGIIQDNEIKKEATKYLKRSGSTCQPIQLQVLFPLETTAR